VNPPKEEVIMSHAPKYSRPVSRPHSQKLEAQLEAFDRSHQARQNAKAQPIKLSQPKPPKR
jgi:hypothetical protein